MPKLPTFDAPPRPARLVSRPPYVLRRIPTTQKVVFLTIDDGARRDPRTMELLRRAHVPVTVFLIGAVANCEPAYFRKLQRSGVMFENHTKHHPDMLRVGPGRQLGEICDTQNDLQRHFGRRPTMFRPPYGRFDSLTQQMAASCGIRHLVLWDITMYGKPIWLRPTNHRLLPGDIILLHFQDDFVDSLANALTLIKASGYTPAALQDYLPAASDHGRTDGGPKSEAVQPVHSSGSR